ncbi:MAG: methyltransferase domain-containing protein [Candidatus Aminicenantes bacterium]|nr:methyltransferase domain-containing protein [Candidatus Aminicenantes bacterium]MDH5383967.1 methyltransferase domain-containing protein [Candidatus Aminicenantes bacterium]
MTDTDSYIKRALESNPLREPILRVAIQALKLLPGSRGLDAGCGIGLQALLLAEEVGPDGHVAGLDISPEFLLLAERNVKGSGLSERISFHEGDINRLPFDNDSFDWVWSADCVGYPTAEEPLPLLRELARVVKPGGKVAILAWSSQVLLPGYPFLEARLNATCSSYIPYVKGKRPESNFLRALGWFHNVGLEESTIHTLIGDVYSPLSDDIRTALISFFEMLWGEPQSDVSQEDLAEYQRLCKPNSPDFILNLPDYYAFFTYSMFLGKVLIGAAQ